MKLRLTCVCILTFAFQGFSQAQEEAVEVYKTVNYSVVALSNLEGNGTGLLLNDDGLILTNAHVVSSPLAFECVIDVPGVKKRATSAKFSKVKIVGVHPTKDLALVQIEPGKFKGQLRPAKLSRDVVVPGQRVYAIGNPYAAGKVMNKTITSGLLSGVAREIDGVDHYQIDAAINPGNSGGPLVDKEGGVIGIVTLKSSDAENVGFAIPLNDFQISEFVPFEKRRSNPQRSREAFNTALKFSREAKRLSDDDPRYETLVAYAAFFYQEAILADPSNAGTYYNFGLMMYRLERFDVCEPYVKRAIEMGPWRQDGRNYWLYGMALYNNGKKQEGWNALSEGTKKFPLQSAQCWELLAMCSEKLKDYETAVFAAEAELATKDKSTRVSMNEAIIARCLPKLTRAERERHQRKTKDIQAELQKREKFAQQQRGKPYILKDFDRMMRQNSSFADGNEQVIVSNEVRTWSDKTGKHRVEAQLLFNRDGKVTLLKSNGRKVTLPLKKLSTFDRAYLRKIDKK